MSNRYAEIAFTDSVKAVQRAQGSRDVYARRTGREGPADELGREERAFIAGRDGFYIATVSETGWPYVQLRGGPPGFLTVTSATEIGFADFQGNRQYITTGNIARDERVALFLMDYPSRRRLKLFGRMRAVEPSSDAGLVDRLRPKNYPGTPERAFLISVAAFDWNCPRYITPRFTFDDILSDSELRRGICVADAPTSAVP